jgi:hypothetical protein
LQILAVVLQVKEESSIGLSKNSSSSFVNLPRLEIKASKNVSKKLSMKWRKNDTRIIEFQKSSAIGKIT